MIIVYVVYYNILETWGNGIICIPLNVFKNIIQNYNNYYYINLFEKSKSESIDSIPLICWLYKNIFINYNPDNKQLLLYNIDIGIIIYLIEQTISEKINCDNLYGICVSENKIYCLSDNHKIICYNFTDLSYPVLFYIFR